MFKKGQPFMLWMNLKVSNTKMYLFRHTNIAFSENISL